MGLRVTLAKSNLIVTTDRQQVRRARGAGVGAGGGGSPFFFAANKALDAFALEFRHRNYGDYEACACAAISKLTSRVQEGRKNGFKWGPTEGYSFEWARCGG